MPVLNIDSDSSLRSYNSLRMQARAQALVSVASESELVEALQWATKNGLGVVPLGGGSNVLLAGNLEALVLCQEPQGMEVVKAATDAVTLRVTAGQNWHELVQWTLQRGFYGLENLALIPGTVGAAPIQNIGAYGAELESVLVQVHALTIANAGKVTLSHKECQFGYRDSAFKHHLQDKLVITAVDLRLSRKPVVNITYPALAQALGEGAAQATPQSIFDAVVKLRKSRLPDPAREPNAGSFFQNVVLSAEQAGELQTQFPEMPMYATEDGRVKLPAAWMIEHCGWKAYRKDDLGVHPQHALVLVNYGSDNGQQLLGLARDITASVQKTFGVDLVIEPRVYGNSP